MTVLHAIREVQLPLVAVMLLGACAAKLVRTIRTGAGDAGLGPTVLFPLRLRRPLWLAMCAIEGGLGLGLIVTAGSHFGSDGAALYIRVGSGLLLLVATFALIELRSTRPDVGCGCFGSFSTAPASGRTLARSALLSVAAFSTIGLSSIHWQGWGWPAFRLLVILVVELVVIAALSPEVGEGLIRLGYSEPCELRHVPSGRTLAVLRRSKQWQRYSGLITSEVPADMWREMCWRYIVYPCKVEDRKADLVFAVFLQQRRPVIRAALVDADTGLPLPWSGPAGPGATGLRALRSLPLRVATAGAGASQPDMRLSTDI